MDQCIVLVTFPNIEQADQVSSALIEEHLAACANRIDSVSSLFRWKNKTECEPEVLVLYKTQVTRLTELTNRVRTLHSYEVPEVIALPIIGGSDEYLQWIDDETQS